MASDYSNSNTTDQLNEHSSNEVATTHDPSGDVVDTTSFWDDVHISFGLTGIKWKFHGSSGIIYYSDCAKYARMLACSLAEVGTAGGSMSLNYDPSSVVDHLKMNGMRSDIESRQQMAADFGIQGEPGSAEWNIALLRHLRG